MDWSLILLGFGASVIVSLATGAGALPILFFRRISEVLRNGLLGFSAGVMLAASCFSLIIPGIAYAQAGVGNRFAAALIVVAAVLIGAAVISVLNRQLLGVSFLAAAEDPSIVRRRVWLFVIAITLHNFPEGLAVGVGFGSGDIANATTLAIGIGLQNVPEGLAVAAALTSVGYTRQSAVLLAAATGLVEPIGGLLGVATVAVFQPLLPWGMGFAAGAMIYVISVEIIPETHRKGHEQVSTAGLMIGFGLMTILDVALG